MAPPRDTIFTYGVAASFIGKDRPYDPTVHVYDFDPRVTPTTAAGGVPPPADRPESGQDAFFVSRVGGVAGAVALGVADGVGGWMDSGVDPADFSHGLCSYMAQVATAGAAETAERGRLPSAQGILDAGYRAVCHDRAVAAGGSTAVVGVLAPDGALDVANLGDSGFVHLRRFAMVACSAPQTHAFNTPYQLSVIPPNLLARMAAFGGAQLSDLPRDADVTHHALRHGDVLVFASDGVWDNLFHQDILAIVSRVMATSDAWLTSTEGDCTSPASPTALRRLIYPTTTASTKSNSNSKSKSKSNPKTLQSVLATQITSAAKAASTNATRNGPFAKEVKRYYPQETWHGGKVDDICVVVAVVCADMEAVEDTEASPIKSKL